MGAAFGLGPSLSALVSLQAPEGRQGAVLGTYPPMGALGRSLGAALGGLLLTAGGWPRPPGWPRASWRWGCCSPCGCGRLDG